MSLLDPSGTLYRYCASGFFLLSWSVSRMLGATPSSGAPKNTVDTRTCTNRVIFAVMIKNDYKGSTSADYTA